MEGFSAAERPLRVVHGVPRRLKRLCRKLTFLCNAARSLYVTNTRPNHTYPASLQTNGFSPVCVAACRTSLQALLNDLPQIRQSCPALPPPQLLPVPAGRRETTRP